MRECSVFYLVGEKQSQDANNWLQMLDSRTEPSSQYTCIQRRTAMESLRISSPN